MINEDWESKEAWRVFLSDEPEARMSVMAEKAAATLVESIAEKPGKPAPSQGI